jgi:hypothetical protein
MRVSVILPILVFCLYSPLARSQSLEQQAMCAKQAQKTFEELDNGYKSDTSFFDYHSHYSTKFKKCFMVTEETNTRSGGQYLKLFLLDAFERRDYARYGEFQFDSTLMCDLMASHKETKHCRTRKEFDEFIAKYME